MKKVVVTKSFFQKKGAEFYVDDLRFNELIEAGVVEEAREETTKSKIYTCAIVKDGKRKILSK